MVLLQIWESKQITEEQHTRWSANESRFISYAMPQVQYNRDITQPNYKKQML